METIFLNEITLPIYSQGSYTSQTYKIPEGFGTSATITKTKDLLQGVDSNSFISLEINDTSTLLKFTGTKLIVMSNSKSIENELYIENGALKATNDCTGNIFYAGKINTSNNTTLSAPKVSLNYIIQNGIVTGITEPTSTTPGQVYIQIS